MMLKIDPKCGPSYCRGPRQ